MIYRGARYAPDLSNYSATAAGRTFPSAAGSHTSRTFFTDDDGISGLDTQEAPAPVDRREDGTLHAEEVLAALEPRIRRLAPDRMLLLPEPPYVEAHNTWVANRPGTLLVIPVGDLAQHVLLALCYMLQNGLVLFDDIHGRAVPGIEQFADIVDPKSVWPITFVEQWSLAELSAELSTSCYAGALMLQAMGLGGWMFNGLDPFSVLGASGNPAAPGLGFRYDANERWPYPNPTGLPGVMIGTCPPHYPHMRAALEFVWERKFGPGGPFHPDTPGPWKDSRAVRMAARPHDGFMQCVAHEAQYVFDTFGKFPGTVPSIFVLTYLQAHHLDLEFYDRFYRPGSYLQTHAEHMRQWHPMSEPSRS
jgi:hypothetical protein